MRPTNKSLLVLSFAVICLFGCEKKSNLLPISGEVFVDNRPASGALVVLSPIGGNAQVEQWKGGYPRGHVDDVGKFVLSTFTVADGAPVGDYVVLISWTSTATNDDVEETELQPDRLGGKYATHETSPLKAVIRPGQLQLPRIDLQLGTAR